nr:hypothetical protein [Tanacetum cinerariifolium]
SGMLRRAMASWDMALARDQIGELALSLRLWLVVGVAGCERFAGDSTQATTSPTLPCGHAVAETLGFAVRRQLL